MKTYKSLNFDFLIPEGYELVEDKTLPKQKDWMYLDKDKWDSVSWCADVDNPQYASDTYVRPIVAPKGYELVERDSEEVVTDDWMYKAINEGQIYDWVSVMPYNIGSITSKKNPFVSKWGKGIYAKPNSVALFRVSIDDKFVEYQYDVRINERNCINSVKEAISKALGSPLENERIRRSPAECKHSKKQLVSTNGIYWCLDCGSLYEGIWQKPAK